jgi:hypothetical protein
MGTDAVSLHQLTMVPEGDEVLIGRLDIDSFAVFPADGAAVVRRLRDGMTPGEVAAWYRAQYGETLDLTDLLETLDELGFLCKDGENPTPVTGPVRFQRLGQVVFSPVAWLLYVGLATALTVLLISHPGYTPHPGQLFFTHSALAVELTVVFGQLPLLFAHEAYHTLAGRRAGLPSRIGVGTRMYILVAETQLNGLLTLPRRKRYLCFLAGMLCDVMLISILDIAGYLLRNNSTHDYLYSRLAFALSFPIVTRIAYQFVLCLQTDLYFVLATALGCQELHGASVALVRNRLSRLLGRPNTADTTGWTEQDLRTARWYAPVLAFGVVVFTGVWIFLIAPVFIQLARLVWDGLQLGTADPAFWDRCCFVTLSLAQLVAAAVIAYRKHAHRRGTRAAAPPAPVGAGTETVPI